ncbi:MAG TPA: hypothetical protein VIL30_04740 [Ramlibacter sp.]|jgi:hypothetical protein
MKNLFAIALIAVPFVAVHADEADASQYVHSATQQSAATQHATAQTVVLGASRASPVVGLTREEVRAAAIAAQRAGTITRGEKGGMPGM